MATQLRLTRHQLSDLQTIRDIEPTRMDLATRQLKELAPVPLHPNELRKVFVGVFGQENPAADALLRQLLSLHALMGQMSLDVAGVFSGLLFGIKNSEPKWTEAEIKKWLDQVPRFQDLLTLRPVRIVEKALNLSYQ